MTDRTCSLLAAGARLALLALVTMIVPARPLRAQCSYTSLASEATVTTTTTPQYYLFNQSAPYWSVVAVRPSGSDDWDIRQYQTTAAYPTCVATLLASSSRTTGVDFVIGDYNHDPAGSYYISVNRFAGSSNAQVEWDQSSGVVFVNAPYLAVPVGSSDVARVYDLYLDAGQDYNFNFVPSGSASLSLLLFRNAAGGNLWTSRSAREFEVTSTTTYHAPSSGWYGVVVVNDNGLTGSFSLQVGTCSAPLSLVSETPVGSTLAENYYSFNQINGYWAAVGVRGTSDWDIGVYASPSGGSYPVCLSGNLAGSDYVPPTVDFVVGDFNYDATGTYYVNPHLYGDAGSGAGTVEWSGGAQQLFVNDALTYRTTDANDVLEVWDVYLYAGASYTVTFQPSGAAATKMLLFRNGVAGTYWAGRAGAVLTTTTTTTYTAPSTGLYGVVVVNDDGGSGTYYLGVGTCYVPTALIANVVSASNAVGYYSLDEEIPYWTAVALRGTDPGTDWDLYAYSNGTGGTFPVCESGLLAGSSDVPPAMDFIVGDFNHNPFGTYDLLASMYGRVGTGAGDLLWDPSQGVITVNGPLISHPAGPSDIVRVWDVLLTAGTTYHFTFTPFSANNKLLLFRNGAGGVYWAGRAGAEFETNGSVDYTAPTSGYYGLVVTDDDGAVGAYWLAVGTCSAPTALSSGTAFYTGLALNYFSFNQAYAYWTAVGVRGAADWDEDLFGSPSGNPFPTCLGAYLSGSYDSPPRADFVVGDFNHNAVGTYYVAARLVGLMGSGTGTVEWDSGPDLLNPGAAAVNRSTDATDVLECWDTYLLPSHLYTFVFTHTGTADLKLCVFRNAVGGTYWAARYFAQLELPASATWKTPASTGGEYYGLVVVNDNGQSGTYTLQVLDAASTGMDPTVVPGVTVLRGIQPNPAHGGVQIEFALHEAGPVRFEVFDLAGRRVAEVAEKEWGAGAWSAAWDGSGSDGARLRPGLYLVRMMSGGRTIGTARLALLE